MAPPDPFPEQDAPDLAALHLNALLVGGASQGIQAPLGFLLGLGRFELVAHAHRLARWVRLCEGNDPSSFQLGQPRLASSSRAITETIDPFVRPSAER